MLRQLEVTTFQQPIFSEHSLTVDVEVQNVQGIWRSSGDSVCQSPHMASLCIENRVKTCFFTFTPFLSLEESFSNILSSATDCFDRNLAHGIRLLGRENSLADALVRSSKNPYMFLSRKTFVGSENP